MGKGRAFLFIYILAFVILVSGVYAQEDSECSLAELEVKTCSFEAVDYTIKRSTGSQFSISYNDVAEEFTLEVLSQRTLNNGIILRRNAAPFENAVLEFRESDASRCSLAELEVKTCRYLETDYDVTRITQCSFEISYSRVTEIFDLPQLTQKTLENGVIIKNSYSCNSQILELTFSGETTPQDIDQRDFDCGDFPCDYFDDEGNYIGPSGVDFDEDAVLEASAGITPDSAFYVLDEIFSRFSSDLENRVEKIAEIRAMIEAGNIEAARKALESYEKYAEVLEKEVSPEEEEEAKRSASAIYNTLIEIEEEIPEEDREDFFEDIIDREGRIFTASQIAGKIKELCETLSELDPIAYGRTCKTNDDSPEWHQSLDRDLTEEQKKEAKKFFGIMSECFETSGTQCRCDEISISAFAEVCAVVAPLEAICDDDSIPEAEAEAACDEVDELTEDIEDLLPEYLIDVLDELIEGFDDDQFDNHAPRECIEAGATTRFECEEIMFDLHAPQECIDAGLTSERECGKFIFSLRAPQECIDAGLTGDRQSDRRKCEDIMRGIEGQHGDRDFRSYGGDCSTFQDDLQRLACYDGALGGGHDDFRQRYEDTREAEKQCAQSCHAEGGAWDFSGGYCECYIPEFEFGFDDYRDKDHDDFGGNEPFFDCSVMFCGEGSLCDPYRGCYQKDSGPGGAQPWEGCEALDCQEGYYCEYGNCIPFEEPGSIEPQVPYDCSSMFCDQGYYCDPYKGCVFDGYFGCDEGYEDDGQGGCIPFGTGDYGFDDTTTEPEPESEPEPEPNTTVTGGIITGNAFLEYYYR